MENLGKEEDRIEKLICETQKKYFKTKEISKMDYEIMMKRCQERLSAIKKQIKMLEKRQL
jgi:enoyl reductase-like protein